MTLVAATMINSRRLSWRVGSLPLYLPAVEGDMLAPFGERVSRTVGDSVSCPVDSPVGKAVESPRSGLVPQP